MFLPTSLSGAHFGPGNAREFQSWNNFPARRLSPPQSPPVLPSNSVSSTNTSCLFPTMSTDPSSSLSSDSLKLCTKKLNDTNFFSWRYNMCNALGYKMLEGFIKEHTPALKRQPDYKD
ncbi:hypothetical protein PCASD_01233 [Puccinia coronata f. sp. avenae]|uniref:Retrotransposon Copia-like N-terminal domain-containing protein n=1 Tax=Puccinia coronata f. sp. avenae TaxID=200324 RepID=A0A2N5VLS1_9BASI|nr:hypothetical protein PCASD_01233 [Puccinia coronata f. sp. avenae]